MENHKTLSESLSRVLAVLHNTGIQYALAGGLAYSALVQPRATMDIDLLIILDDTAFNQAMAQFEQYFDPLIVHKTPMQFHGLRILRAVGYVGQKEMIVDFLLAESEFHRHVIERAVAMDFLGCRLKVVTIEDLVLLKKCAHRPQDLVDIETTYTLCRNDLDHEYIARWSKTLMLL